ncbi:MAG: PIN domain-containing protein [Candidatus Dormibacteraeota bacterium]|nr:PIN domain-containing protein [Candidatus Dormibacteraeota bacterium]
MHLFVDTSALYALLDADDAHHLEAEAWFAGWTARIGETLLTHNYVVVEIAALVQRRLGQAATRALFEDLVPVVSVVYVDEPMHHLAESAYLTVPAGPSFVDCVSFQVMRARGLREAFAFDDHFTKQGLQTLP